MSESVSFASSSSSFSFEPLKILFLGDAQVGKSKLIERFRSLLDKFNVEFYETDLRNLSRRTEKRVHACLLILDATRPSTWTHFDRLYKDLREIHREVPILCVLNKIEVTKRPFDFSPRPNSPLYFVSAADGTNVQRLFDDALRSADAFRRRESTDSVEEFLREFDNFHSESVDSPSHLYENHQTERTESSTSPISKCCIGKTRRLTECFLKLTGGREEKKSKFWLNLLLAEEWNYFYLLKDKAQPFDEQERHIKRLHNAPKLGAILEIYLNSFVPQRMPSSFDRTVLFNHYERLQCLFNSLAELIRTKSETKLCATILERLNYLLKKMKEFQHEEVFLQFPSYVQRTLILSSNDRYQTLEILSADRQTLIERLPLYLIVGLNLQENQKLLVLSVEQPRRSNSVHNFHFAHTDPTVIQQWYQLLDKHIKQVKSDHMNKYQEYRI